MRRSYLPIHSLVAPPYSAIIGYPRAAKRQIESRLRELKGLCIASVSLQGPLQIGKLSVLGKGYVGIVVLAKTESGRRCALKIRRRDSQRKTMRDEARHLRLANAVKVGPAVYADSRNFIVMEFVDGIRISDWIRNLAGRGSAAKLKKVIRQVLEACFRLDCSGIDHGELSNLAKHVVVSQKGPVLVDFDSASTKRRVSNVTSATQGIFIGSAISGIVRRTYAAPRQDAIIEALRAYKSDPGRKAFDLLISVLKL